MTKADLAGDMAMDWLVVCNVILGCTGDEYGVGGWVKSKPVSEEYSQKGPLGLPIIALRLGGSEPMIECERRRGLEVSSSEGERLEYMENS